MAVMISKVVRSGGTGPRDGLNGSSSHKSHPTNTLTSRVVISGGPPVPRSGNSFLGRIGKDVEDRAGSSGSEVNLADYPSEHGIRKTTETRVVVDCGDDSSHNGSM